MGSGSVITAAVSPSDGGRCFVGMPRKALVLGLGSLSILAGLVGAPRAARAGDATVTVGSPRFSDPPPESSSEPTPIAVDEAERLRHERESRETTHFAVSDGVHRAPFRLQLGPQGVTTGKGFGLGVGLGLDVGSGSAGGRLSASWLRGEGTSSDGTSTPTGDSVGVYGGEVTLDLHKRGPLHPVVGMGVGFLHVSRKDASGNAGVGTGRLGLEYSLGLDDADVRIGGSVTGGLVGPADDEIKDLRAYALASAHLAIGF